MLVFILVLMLLPSGGSRGARLARQAELAEFLRARRARLRPADVGLPEEAGRRRTPGLRREEVARLSGVGVTWYTWLEQGRDIAPSAQVVDALARALLLDDDQHRHLRELTGLPAAEPPAPAGALLPRLQRLVDAAAPNIASVYDAHFDYLAWNHAYARVRHDPARMPAQRRNLLWMMFTDPVNRERMAHWEGAARAVLSQFRAAAGRHPDDPRYAQVIAGLSEASPEFRDWWAQYPVRSFRPATIAVDHPDTGRIHLELYQLRPVEHPDLLLVVQVPVGDQDARRVARLITS
jgi:transcriptional regulator with XRE-family HTH domain